MVSEGHAGSRHAGDVPVDDGRRLCRMGSALMEGQAAAESAVGAGSGGDTGGRGFRRTGEAVEVGAAWARKEEKDGMATLTGKRGRASRRFDAADEGARE